MNRHRPQLVADFHRYYGLSLRSMREWGIPLDEVSHMAAHLPLGSAVHHALDEHWQRTPELDILRNLEHEVRVLLWQNTADGAKGRMSSYPERMRLPWDPAPEGAIVGDVMTQDEADKFLGWDKLKKEEATRQ